MSRVCSVCEKGKMSGNRVSHSNRKSPHQWSANVHKIKVQADNGSVSSEYVCTKCMKSGKVNRAK